MINVWKPGKPNLGDSMNVPLVQYITGEKPNAVRRVLDVDTIYLVIGSCLQTAWSNSIIWGAGYISLISKVNEIPKKIHAVRGPETRRRLHEQKIDCPEIYGDPALLYPRYYKPNVQKKYKLGIVPHYIDKIVYTRRLKGVLVIDVQGEVNKVIDQICSCEKIASSSLHGLIVADAYGIPSTWLEFSDKVIGKGFKFRDYFMSVHRPMETPLRANNNTSVQEILNRFHNYSIDIDLDKLYSVCPFKK